MISHFSFGESLSIISLSWLFSLQTWPQGLLELYGFNNKGQGNSKSLQRYRKYQCLTQIFQNNLCQDGLCSGLTHAIKKSDCGKTRSSLSFSVQLLSIYLSLVICQVPVEHWTTNGPIPLSLGMRRVELTAATVPRRCSNRGFAC